VDELVAGLLLENEPRLGANLARREGEQCAEGGGHDNPAAPEQDGAGQRDDDRGDDQRPPRSNRRDQDERREERAQQAADGRKRVQATGDRPRVADVVDCEAQGERRDHAEQDHGRREQQKHREERPDRRPGRDPVEPLDRDVEERARRKRHDRDQDACPEHDATEKALAWVAVRDPAAQPVSERETREDEPDHVRPHDRRAPVIGREQPGSGDLGGERTGARAEDQDVQRVQGVPALRRPSRSLEADRGH
jgi:hypothetical protein